MLISFDDCRIQNLRYGNLPLRNVLHIGAHIGEEGKSYELSGIKKVIWVEGNKDLLPKLKSNTFELKLEQQYFNLILSDNSEKVVFNITNNQQSSSILKLGSHKDYYSEIKITERRNVESTRFDNFYQLYDNKEIFDDIDFMNIDVQGVELRVLKGFGDLIERFPIKCIYTEINLEEIYVGCNLVEEIDLYLSKYRFHRVKTVLTQNKWGDALYIREI